MKYKESFKEHYSKLTNWNEYWSTVKEFAPQSIRVNTIKISVSDLKKRLSGWKLKPIPWIKEGFWISGARRDLGNLYEHKLGYFYCQDACSMIPALALNPKKNDFVLDMCAAPGSKTTQMSAMMEGKGLIIANDIDYRRIIALSANVQRLGCSNVVIVNHNGLRLKGSFDKILLDAPCTGYGTIRGETKNSIKNLKEWNLGASKQMSGIQKGLIVKAFDLLKKGGIIVYSTCSLEPIEDEDVVAYLLKKRPDAKLVSTGLDIKSKVNSDEFEKCLKAHHTVADWPSTSMLKVWPQFYNTEGFFIAKLRKM